jgi:glycosyltransferase involved in cell wall biosynthesis
VKPLHVSTYDSFGGAARATWRLHRGMKSAHIQSSMLVQDKRTDDPFILGPSSSFASLKAKLRPRLDSLLSSVYQKRCNGLFSSAFVPSGILKSLKHLDADLIHLHWVNEGFLRIEEIAAFKLPIVWTLHDMWPFTGGCHHSGSCERYRITCGSCPHLRSHIKHDLSRWTLFRKSRAWKDLNITVICPSNWLAECARSSSLFDNFPVEVIPNGIDTVGFAPHDKKFCRAILGLPQDCVILLAGGISFTSDKNKGMLQLMSALKLISPGVEVAILGSSGQNPSLDLGIPVHFLGHLHDEVSLAVAYAAADIFVSPSLQENLSNMVMEASACGLPTVAFSVGGMADLIDSDRTGFLVAPGCVDELSKAINTLVEDYELRDKFGKAARSKVEREFAIENIVRRYLQVYDRISKC